MQGWIQSSSSDLHKSLKFFPNLISQLFIAVDEINYLPCFIVYYEINKTTERLFRRSHSKPSPSRAKWTSHRSRGFVLCWFFENHAKKISQARPDKVSTKRVGTGGMDLFTNHSKPTSIGQNHSHCLTNYSNSIVIGYSGRKLPCKLLTIIYKEKPLPQKSLRSCWIRKLGSRRQEYFDL